MKLHNIGLLTGFGGVLILVVSLGLHITFGKNIYFDIFGLSGLFSAVLTAILFVIIENWEH